LVNYILKTIISLKKNITLVIEKEGNKNHIKYFKNGKQTYEWTDHIKEDNSLIREIGKTTIFWKLFEGINGPSSSALARGHFWILFSNFHVKS
jgi:hypothetical protein